MAAPIDKIPEHDVELRDERLALLHPVDADQHQADQRDDPDEAADNRNNLQHIYTSTLHTYRSPTEMSSRSLFWV